MAGNWSRRVVLAGMGAAAFIQPSFAADRGKLAKLRQQGSMKIAIANGLPWSQLNPDGTLSGIAPEIVLAVAPRIGIPKVEATVSTYGELVPGLQAGRWDMIGASLTISPERCRQVLFCDPFFREDATQWVGFLPGTVKTPPKSFVELTANFESIGVSTGSAELPYLNQAMATAGKKPTLVPFGDSPLLIDALITKRVPIVTADAKTMHLFQKQRGNFEIAPVDPGHVSRGSAGAFHLEDHDLHDAFVAEFRAMRTSGQIAAILKKYDFEYDPKFMDFSGEQACAIP